MKRITQVTEEEIYEEAKRRVEARRGFYGHLVAYVVVNTILVCIWAFVGGRGYPWFAWVLGFWGLGLFLNFMDVFVWKRKSARSAIEKEAEKIRKEQK